jgi:hypothetical protein
MVGWERVYGKMLQVVAGNQQYFSTGMKLHPCAYKGRCGAYPYIVLTLESATLDTMLTNDCKNLLVNYINNILVGGTLYS